MASCRVSPALTSRAISIARSWSPRSFCSGRSCARCDCATGVISVWRKIRAPERMSRSVLRSRRFPCSAAARCSSRCTSTRSGTLFSGRKCQRCLFAASVVPVLEEILFRGFILGVLLRSFSRFSALLITSALFSIIHFLKAPEQTTPAIRSPGSRALSRSRIPSGNLATRFCSQPVSSPSSRLVASWPMRACKPARSGCRSDCTPGWIFANGIFSRGARDVLALPWLGKDLLVGIVPLMIALASWVLMRSWVKHERARARQPVSRTR